MSVTETRDTTDNRVTHNEEEPKKVAVLGAGIAGLTAAHELARRGYQVTVFEARGSGGDDLGGKARSFTCRNDAGDKLFGEHGFRFFPGFYRHVIETMEDIPAEGGHTVDRHLKEVSYSSFYARRFSDPIRQRGLPKGLAMVAFRVKAAWVWLFLPWLLIAGPLVVDHFRWWPFLAWLAFPLVWYIARTVAFALGSSRNDSCLQLTIPTSASRATGNRLRRQLLVRWPLRLPGVILAFALLALADHPWRLAPFAVLAALICWLYPALATIRGLWSGVLQRVPPDVRPGILESIAASFKIAAVITSGELRTYRQWEQENWWSFMNAYRYSHPFQLVFATGLTRSFVATRAEQMSARTGATILAQLLYDISPTLDDRGAADRVLAAPTHVAWIHPWISRLTSLGVRFNDVPGVGQLDRVIVRKLLTTDEPGPDGRFPPPGEPSISGFVYTNPDGFDLSVTGEFDHYVLALSGIAAQRVLESSEQVLRVDRSVGAVDLHGDPTPGQRALVTGRSPLGGGRVIPYLDGIFALDFGWMTGLVYHLDHDPQMAEGHHLCLESEWALTAIDYARIWSHEAHMAPPGCRIKVEPWQSIISVNVSDWFSPSPLSPPARLGDRKRIREEVWRQLQEHVEALAGVELPPDVVTDTALRDETETGPTEFQALLAHPRLANDEQLLINTARSWQKRPMAQTVFSNLVMAGDYVRTSTDFASMESANESAKRAANVILDRDRYVAPAGSGDLASRCTVWPALPEPKALKGMIGAVRFVDNGFNRAGFPHPLTVVGAPFGWFAGIEQFIRHRTIRNRPDSVVEARARSAAVKGR